MAENPVQFEYDDGVDWRVRMQLAPSAENYSYAALDGSGQSIMAPLANTNGVIFPYTPDISVTYAATYDNQDLIHNNYKIWQYKNSSVDQITVGCTFTAQDVQEARYVLAVVHFFRTMTKMFYGQDTNPRNGTPPPLCYLSGLGAFQFNQHPLVISNFTYALPDDVDYIKTSGVTRTPLDVATNRYDNSGVIAGGAPQPPDFSGSSQNNPSATAGYDNQTYVPTKIKLSVTCLPVVSRNDISNSFSLEKYSTGEVYRGRARNNGAGIW